MMTQLTANAQATVAITGLAHGGYGVCRIEGEVCFVPYGLPGDSLRIRLTARRKGLWWGEIEAVLEPSSDRGAPCCPKFGQCGGCTWLHFAYPGQEQWKRRIIGDCLQRIAGIETDVDWAEDAASRLGYRTRAEFHAANGRLGFYAQSSHAVVDIDRCPLCHETLNAALERLRALPVRDSVQVVTNPDTGETMIWTQHPHRSLREAFDHVGCPADEQRHHFLFDGVPIVNGAFSQSSLLINRVLVRTVHALIGNTSSVLDLYCGNGNLTLNLPESVRVLGLDHNGAAVRAANDRGRGAYRAGGEDVFRAALQEPWDTVVLDPPRTGAKTIVEDLARCAAGAIVYVSCDPATLARDLKTLAGHGWQVRRAVAVDLFPHTAHVETACRLEPK